MMAKEYQCTCCKQSIMEGHPFMDGNYLNHGWQGTPASVSTHPYSAKHLTML